MTTQSATPKAYQEKIGMHVRQAKSELEEFESSSKGRDSRCIIDRTDRRG